MDLRKAVSRNLVPVLVITVAYEVGYPILRQLATTAIRVTQAKITRASDRSLPMSEEPARVVEKLAPAGTVADEPAPAVDKPVATRPVRRRSSASSTRAR